MKLKIHYAETIDEAVKDLEVFFIYDMWYAKEAEWKNEEQMIKYLKYHFNILKNSIKRINKKVKRG